MLGKLALFVLLSAILLLAMARLGAVDPEEVGEE